MRARVRYTTKAKKKEMLNSLEELICLLDELNCYSVKIKHYLFIYLGFEMMVVNEYNGKIITTIGNSNRSIANFIKEETKMYNLSVKDVEGIDIESVVLI